MTPHVAVDITPMQTAHKTRGIGRYVRGLAHELSQQDQVPLTFIGWKDELDLDVASPHRLSLLPRPPMPRYRGAWLFAELGMATHLALGKYGCVHVTAPEALIASRRTVILTTVYDLIPLREGIRMLPPLGRLGYLRYLRSLKSARGHFAISAETAQEVRRLIGPAAPVVLAEPGVDVSGASRRAPPPGMRPFFLFVGGPNPNKNLEVVLDALALSPAIPEELLVAGFWLPAQTAALMARLALSGLKERVRIIGHVPDMELWQLMREATAVIVPSTAEGFGLPVAEAIALGAVLIHSDIDVFKATSRGAALSFSPYSPSDLKAQMERVSRDPDLRSRLRQMTEVRGRQLTWDSAIANTLAAYRSWTVA